MTGDGQVCVVLQHSNRLFRELLADHLARDPSVVVAAVVPTRARLAELCLWHQPDVAVFEADGRGGADLATRLHRTGRVVRLVALAAGSSPADLVRACEDGAGTVVPYSSGLRALLDVVRRGAPSEPRTVRRATPRLTAREQQVLCLMSAGNAPRQVAAVLGISLRTVENHKQQIFAKLDVHSQAHAVAYAVRLGLVGSSAAPSDPPDVLVLTRREREILASIGFGRTTRQTASELGISARTVENLQSTLFRKLRVHNRTAALVAAHDLRLIEV